MAASRDLVQTIFRQLFVRNMTASDADQAADRLLDLYFSDGAVDVSDSNLSTLNLSSAGNVNAVTVNATTAVNTVTCRASTSMNTATVNATTAVNTIDARATNVNATVGNITTAITTDARATNVNATVGNVTDVRATNVNTVDSVFKTAVVTFTNVNGATCSSTNAIQAGWFVVGVAANVTANVAGATSINIGDGSSDNAYNVITANVAGTKVGWNGTLYTSALKAANTNVVLTPITSNFDGNGNVTVYVTYMKSLLG